MPIPRELRHHYRGEAWEAARQACYERAGHRCQDCGLRNGARGWRDRTGHFFHAAGPHWKRRCGSRKVITIQLGAAHLNHTPGDDRPENLRALCRKCHLANDRNHHRETREARKDRERPILALLAGAKARGEAFEAMGHDG